MVGMKTKVMSRQDIQVTMDSTFVDEWELFPSQFVVEGVLGGGAFGVVRKGYIKGLITNCKVDVEFRGASCVPVAIKMLKGKYTWQ